MSDTPRKYAQCTREEWFERWEAWNANDYIAEEEQMAMRDCFAHIEELERENADLRAKLAAERIEREKLEKACVAFVPQPPNLWDLWEPKESQTTTRRGKP